MMGVLSMERMRGGEMLLDCRGVDALHNPDMYNECDFALAVGSNKVVIQTRSDANTWIELMTAHNKAAYSHQLSRVYSLTQADGEIWAVPSSPDEETFTVSSIASRFPAQKEWPNTRILAIASLRLPDLSEEAVKSWLEPVFTQVFGPSTLTDNEQSSVVWTLSRRLNAKNKWGRQNILFDFLDPEKARAAVYSHMSVFQSDTVLGGIQWTLSSRHYPILEEHSVLEGFGKLAIEDSTKSMEASRNADSTLADFFAGVGTNMDKLVEESKVPQVEAVKCDDEAAVHDPPEEDHIIADGVEKEVQIDDANNDMPTPPLRKAQGKNRKRVGASPFKEGTMTDSPAPEQLAKRASNDVAPRQL
jgi:hypothetical protein